MHTQHAHTQTHTHTRVQFTPRAGPTEGGTMVVIHGLNFGAHQSDIEYVRIDGIPCSVTDYRPGVRYRSRDLDREQLGSWLDSYP